MTHKWFKVPSAGEGRFSFQPNVNGLRVWKCANCGKETTKQPSQTERCKRKFG